jgi:hypothetical protein
MAKTKQNRGNSTRGRDRGRGRGRGRATTAVAATADQATAAATADPAAAATATATSVVPNEPDEAPPVDPVGATDAGVQSGDAPDPAGDSVRPTASPGASGEVRARGPPQEQPQIPADIAQQSASRLVPFLPRNLSSPDLRFLNGILPCTSPMMVIWGC